MPPVIVHRATMKVIDGTYRVGAARLQRRDTIATRFFDGSAEEAFILAVAANINHGMPLTLKERKFAAIRILGMYTDWSDRMIADATGLSHPTVATIRRKQSGGKNFHLNKRIGRDGKTYPPTVSHRAAVQPTRTDQNASMHETARRGGAAAGTADDNDERPRPHQSVEPMVAISRGAALDFHLARAKAVLRRLWNDPAMRSHEKGKAVLELISHSLRTAIDAQVAVKSAPEHCRNAMAEYAAACGDSWHRVAKDLRTKSQAG